MKKSKILGMMKAHKGKLPVVVAIGVVAAGIAAPEEAQATLVETVGKVDGIVSGPVKKLGLTGATIGGGAWALIKGNTKLAGMIVVVAVIISVMLGWIGGGISLGSVD